MQVSLGRSVADEIRPGIYKVSKAGMLYAADKIYYP